MTISDTTSYVTYTGNGSLTGPYDVPFYFGASAELTVTLRTGDTVTAQTLTTHYTVTGAGTTSGTVTFVTAPTSGYEIRIERNTAMTQTLDLISGGAFDPPNVMSAFDKLTRIVQDLSRGTGGGGGSPGTYDSDPMTKTASGAEWDAEGLIVSNAADAVEDADLVTLSQVTTLIEDVSAATLAAAEEAAQSAAAVAALVASIEANVAYAVDVGDGAATQITITHSFGTYDVNVQVFRNSANRETVDDTLISAIERMTTDTVRITFLSAPSASQFRVIVLAKKGGLGVGFQHTQGSASVTWTIDHNLGFRPHITVFDTTGEVVQGAITNPSLNQSVVTFYTALAGSARCT